LKLLVIEASTAAAKALAKTLSVADHIVDHAPTAEKGRHLALNCPYSLIILDPALPDDNGITLCRILRTQGLRIPILVLSELDTPEAAIEALDAGADDFVSRPYDPGELVARVRSLLRRGLADTGDTLRVMDLELHLIRRTATRGGHQLDLAPKEFAVLECLMRHAGRTLSRNMITSHVWHTAMDTAPNLIDVYISNLRKALGQPPMIRTIPGTGYQLTGGVPVVRDGGSSH
jgi:two-component system, OmpR family, response regulator